MFTQLRPASKRVLDRGQWDIGADDGVLIPGRVIDVERASLGTELDPKADSLVVVGPPPTAELVIDTWSP